MHSPGKILKQASYFSLVCCNFLEVLRHLGTRRSRAKRCVPHFSFFILLSALVCLTLALPKLGGGSEKCKQVCFFAHLALTLYVRFEKRLKDEEYRFYFGLVLGQGYQDFWQCRIVCGEAVCRCQARKGSLLGS